MSAVDFFLYAGFGQEGFPFLSLGGFRANQLPEKSSTLFPREAWPGEMRRGCGPGLPHRRTGGFRENFSCRCQQTGGEQHPRPRSAWLPDGESAILDSAADRTFRECGGGRELCDGKKVLIASYERFRHGRNRSEQVSISTCSRLPNNVLAIF